jgi:GDP-L-fucose synthase
MELLKKALLVQLQAYRQQYGLNGIYLLPVNLYGPHDNFDLNSSHVIPALIRKIQDALNRNDQSVKLWGDGSPTREFIYVDDAAQGIVMAAQKFDRAEPVNIGSGNEISIRALAIQIADLMGYRGDFEWDPSQPNGQPRRMLDTQRAKNWFGFQAQTSLEQGLKQTIRWYRDNYQ